MNFIMKNKHIYFPYYSGNIKFTKSQGLVSIHDFIESHKNPKENILEIFNEIKKVNDKPKLKRELKQKLFSFTPSVIIEKGLKRSYSNVKEYTGIMQLDFDKLETEDKANILKNNLFEDDNFIICSYLSPSRKGVKCLAKITKPENKEHYKAIQKAMYKYFVEFKKNKYFDNATNNAMLPLFLSYDENILYTDISKCDTFDKEDWSVKEYVQLNNKKTHTTTSNEFNYKKTIRIFSKKINEIIDNGHTQLRSACLILGSRSGAGYIDINESINLSHTLIDNNNYLQKDLKNYKSTATWAIKEGYKKPKFY